MKKLHKVLGLALALLVLSVIPARAEDVREVYQKINNINPGLVDYQATLNVDVNAKWAFIPYSPKLSGHYYYQAADKHKLVLEDAPSFLKKYPNAFGFHLPELTKYNGVVNGTTELNGRECILLTMTPKDPNKSVQSVQLWVDAENYTVPRQITNYKDNGRLSVNANYVQDQGYWVFDNMRADFSFPKVKVNATAKATYRDYRFNIGLTDAFFEKDKK